MTVGLVAALTFAVTPGAALASRAADGLPATASGDDASVLATWPRQSSKIWWGPNNQSVRASAWIVVYQNGTKQLNVCDSDPRDGIGLAIQVDPTGSGPPDTLVYYDTNAAAAGCLKRTIGYSVRKWRFVSVYHNGAAHDFNHAWQIYPLPRADF